MSAIDVSLSLAWRQCVALIGLIRLMPAQIPGGARRLEVAEKIVALDKTRPEGLDQYTAMTWRCELVLNREHLGSLKIGLLGLWSSKDGATQEQIVDVAKGLRLWTKHVEPVVVKEEVEAIVELDGEADLGDLDELCENLRAPNLGLGKAPTKPGKKR